MWYRPKYLPCRIERKIGIERKIKMTSTAKSRRSASKSVSVRRPKAAVRVAAELRRQIVAGHLKPGDKLHPENVLQTEFAISRPTLREALRLLESESLISIARGKYGGARVTSIDLGAIANQVGVFLQVKGTTLEDVWLARTVIEPPAAGLLATRCSPEALAELEANIADAREASRYDLLRYADLSAEFSMLIIRHCGNKTIHLLTSLIYDIIRRQHEHVTEWTLSKASVDKLRQDSIRSREKAVELMREGDSAAVESFWRSHIERMRDLVLSAYEAPMTIDILNEPVTNPHPVGKIRRQAQSVLEEVSDE